MYVSMKDMLLHAHHNNYAVIGSSGRYSFEKHNGPELD